MIDEATLTGAVIHAAPRASLPGNIAKVLLPRMLKENIDTPRRVAAFLGQISVESAGFSRTEENLFYSTPSRIAAVWPSRVPSAEAAESLGLVRNPERLANFVYANR